MSSNNKTEGLIKELGRKARERLEAENQKRREVVCLDATDLPKPPPPPVAATAAANSRKRQFSPRKTRVDDDEKTDTKKAAQDAKNAPKLPKVTSSIVCMHGFPDDVATVGHVKRFLSGIDVMTVYIPLFTIPAHTIHRRASLPKDTTTDGTKRQRKDAGETTTTTTDRQTCVFVRLTSPNIAALAVARSGEPAVGLEDKDDSRNEEIRIWVADVRPSAFTKVESILITCWKGGTFSDVRSTVLRDLHPAVKPILRYYCQHASETGETRSTGRDGNSKKVRIPGLHEDDLDAVVSCDEGIEDRIQDLVDELQYQLPFIDLANELDPIACLTREAVRLLKTRRLEQLRRGRLRQFRLAYL